jgi:hypothetical protein
MLKKHCDPSPKFNYKTPGAKIKPDGIQQLVAYIRSLAAKK